MKFERELGEKGQVVIPKDIRDLLGLRSGQKVVFETRTHKL
jgi:AbrB family looped-hinge helix DNA binding protein